MQALMYYPDCFDIFPRHHIERELVLRICEERPLLPIAQRPSRQSYVFDCHELGICLVKADFFMNDVAHYETQWFSPRIDTRANKPRIVTTITETDEVSNTRKRWFFALSKVGYLYCVAYEFYKRTWQGWRLTEWYRSWRPDSKQSILRKEDAVPEDWVFREAERRWKKATTRKGKNK